MIGPIEELHISSNFFFKVKALSKKKIGCILHTPEFRIKSNIKPNTRTYTYKDEVLTIKDDYKNKTNKVKLPRSVVRPIICLDIIRLCDTYEVSPNLIILYDENDQLILSQDLTECIQLELTSEETKEEKALFDELEGLLSHQFSNEKVFGYKYLQNCIINGGLV